MLDANYKPSYQSNCPKPSGRLKVEELTRLLPVGLVWGILGYLTSQAFVWMNQSTCENDIILSIEAIQTLGIVAMQVRKQVARVVHSSRHTTTDVSTSLPEM